MVIAVIIVIVLIILYNIGKSAENKESNNVTTSPPTTINHEPAVHVEEETDISDAAIYILQAKEYFYETFDIIKDRRNSIVYNDAPCITKDEKKIINDAYLKLEKSKSKFKKVFGSGKANLEKCMRKGIYNEICSSDGTIERINYDLDGILKYLSDIDYESKSKVIERCRIFKYIYDENTTRDKDSYNFNFTLDILLSFSPQLLFNPLGKRKAPLIYESGYCEYTANFAYKIIKCIEDIYDEYIKYC